MTIELVLLMSLYVFILFGFFFGEKGPRATFEKSAPRLAARMEAQISTGSGFADPKGVSQTADSPWKKPNGRPPGGF